MSIVSEYPLTFDDKRGRLYCKVCQRWLPPHDFAEMPKTDYARGIRRSKVCQRCEYIEEQRKRDLVHLERLKSNDKRSGFVYVIRCEQYYKIGVTKDGKRSWSTDNPFEIEVIKMFKSKDRYIAENALHLKYQQYRHRGEWFKLPITEVEWLASLVDVDSILESL